MKEVKFDTLVGKTITRVSGLEVGSNGVSFYTYEGPVYNMVHHQDCCESVEVAEVIGDINDLIDTPVLDAYEDSNEDHSTTEDCYESYTWTFYRITTIKGTVVIRWLGRSNGYYSESVSFEEV